MHHYTDINAENVRHHLKEHQSRLFRSKQNKYIQVGNDLGSNKMLSSLTNSWTLSRLDTHSRPSEHTVRLVICALCTLKRSSASKGRAKFRMVEARESKSEFIWHGKCMIDILLYALVFNWLRRTRVHEHHLWAVNAVHWHAQSSFFRAQSFVVTDEEHHGHRNPYTSCEKVYCRRRRWSCLGQTLGNIKVDSLVGSLEALDIDAAKLEVLVRPVRNRVIRAHLVFKQNKYSAVCASS